MAVAARRGARTTVVECRVQAAAKPRWERWESFDGVPIPMSPPLRRQQLIIENLLRRLADFAAHRECRALPGLVILSEAMDDFAPIPDIVVR